MYVLLSTRATRLYDHLDFLREQKKEAETDLLREAKKHAVVRILETAPGFGPRGVPISLDENGIGSYGANVEAAGIEPGGRGFESPASSL